MRVTCPSCQTNYNIDDTRIPPGGANLKCAKCQTLFVAKGAHPTIVESSVPLPGVAPLRARSSAPPASPSSPTIAANALSVPLPGSAAGRVAKFEEGLSSVALPGRSNAKPIQLPGLEGLGEDLNVEFAEAEPVEPSNGSAQQASLPPLSALGGASAPHDEIAQGGEPAPTELDFNFDFASADPSAPAAAQFAAVPSPSESPLAAPTDELNFELTEAPNGELPKDRPPDGGLGSDAFDFAESAPLQNAPTPQQAGPSPSPADEVELAGADDNLELLSFTENAPSAAAGEKAAALRYQVRRKTGKVFGPFEQSIVARMLEDGQLSGTEDVSADGTDWAPIGSIPEFREKIASLAQAPADLSTEPATGQSEGDRLKRLYEGRMAAVNVTRSHSFFDSLKDRARLLVIAGAVLVAVAAGASLNFTRYGAFGLRKLFSTHVSRSSPQFVMLQNARKDFVADTYKSYREANELAAAVLKVRDYPEARAVWCQSVYYLLRRFSDAKPGDIVKADASLEDIELLGRKDLDYVKAIAGARLAENKAGQALAVLQEAAARNENAGDLELALLLAEAYAAQGQSRLALETIGKAIERHKGSARALHALGKLHQAANDADKAAKAFSAALEADAGHLSSGVELAAIELLSRNNPHKALQSLELPLSDKGMAILGPTELGRARALKGSALQALSKNREAMAELEEALKLDPTSVFAKERLAQLLLADHQFAKAVPLYREVVDKDPQNLSATEGYLSSLIGSAKMDDALQAVAQANARFPGKARIAYFDGRVNDALDKPDEAEKHYKRAINADPKLVDSALYLSRLYLRARRAADAKAQLEQALERAPSDARVRAAMGELAMLQSDVPRARAELQKAVELDEKLPEAHLGLSKLAIEDGALEKARAEVEKALELDPHVKDGRYQHGVVLWRARQFDEALAELEKAKAEDSKSVRISIALGAVLLEKGDLPLAESTLLAALSADPINAEGHFYLAKVKSRRGEYSQAIDSMRNALDRAPDRADYHYEMGLIYRDAKKMSDAIQEWKRAVEIDASQADSLEALGRAYLDRAELDKAIDSFEQTLRVDARRTRVLAQIGDSYFQAGKWDRAIAAYLNALKADGSLTQVFYKLGRSYTEKGKHAQAIEWYRKAVAAEPDKPMPYYYLGYAYKEKHKKREAVEAFKSYLALRTDAEDKREIEDEIYDLQHD